MQSDTGSPHERIVPVCPPSRIGVALFFGLFEVAFLVMAWRAAPGVAPIVHQARDLPLGNPGYLCLLAANLGTSVIPWVLSYQQSASIDKGLGPEHIGGARLETLAAIVLCQTITSALLIAAGATLGNGATLNAVPQIETAFTVTLGPAIRRAVFIVGLSGGALVATIVVCLTLARSVGEVLGAKHSLEHHPRQAPWFYGSLIVMLLAGGALVGSGIDLVSPSIAAGVLNVLLLPPVLGFLYRLAHTVLPDTLRLRGAYAARAELSFVTVSGVGLYAGIASLP